MSWIRTLSETITINLMRQNHLAFFFIRTYCSIFRKHATFRSLREANCDERSFRSELPTRVEVALQCVAVRDPGSAIDADAARALAPRARVPVLHEHVPLMHPRWCQLVRANQSGKDFYKISSDAGSGSIQESRSGSNQHGSTVRYINIFIHSFSFKINGLDL
jgi:hypothetical protein